MCAFRRGDTAAEGASCFRGGKPAAADKRGEQGLIPAVHESAQTEDVEQGTGEGAGQAVETVAFRAVGGGGVVRVLGVEPGERLIVAAEGRLVQPLDLALAADERAEGMGTWAATAQVPRIGPGALTNPNPGATPR